MCKRVYILAHSSLHSSSATQALDNFVTMAQSRAAAAAVVLIALLGDYHAFLELGCGMWVRPHHWL